MNHKKELLWGLRVGSVLFNTEDTRKPSFSVPWTVD